MSLVNCFSGTSVVNPNNQPVIKNFSRLFAFTSEFFKISCTVIQWTNELIQVEQTLRRGPNFRFLFFLQNTLWIHGLTVPSKNNLCNLQPVLFLNQIMGHSRLNIIVNTFLRKQGVANLWTNFVFVSAVYFSIYDIVGKGRMIPGISSLT